MTHEQAKSQAVGVREGLLNSIAPMIRQQREIQRNKPRDIHTYVVKGGDIVVEEFTFVLDCWQKLIPNMIELAVNEVLPEIFDGTFQHFLLINLIIASCLPRE